MRSEVAPLYLRQLVPNSVHINGPAGEHQVWVIPYLGDSFRDVYYQIKNSVELQSVLLPLIWGNYC